MKGTDRSRAERMGGDWGGLSQLQQALIQSLFKTAPLSFFSPSIFSPCIPSCSFHLFIPPPLFIHTPLYISSSPPSTLPLVPYNLSPPSIIPHFAFLYFQDYFWQPLSQSLQPSKPKYYISIHSLSPGPTFFHHLVQSNTMNPSKHQERFSLCV